jgi:homoserine kinase
MKGQRNMNIIVKKMLAPLARRLGSMAAGAVGGSMVIDPALATRIEMWASAGAFLLIDVIVAYTRRNTQEVG